MFIVKTREASAAMGLPHRGDVLHIVNTWDSELDPETNAARRSPRLSSGDPDFTPHRIIGAVPVPGEDFWVVVVQEGE